MKYLQRAAALGGEGMVQERESGGIRDLCWDTSGSGPWTSGSPNHPRTPQRGTHLGTPGAEPSACVTRCLPPLSTSKTVTEQMCPKPQQRARWPSSTGAQRRSYFTPEELVNLCSEQHSRSQTNMTPRGICASGRHILSLHKQGKMSCIYL